MITIKFPQAGKDMASATVVRWAKSVGQAVRPGDVLVELQTERSLVQVQADRDGRLAEILAEKGRTVTVGGPLARIAEGGSPQADETPAKRPADTGAVHSRTGALTERREAAAMPTGRVVPILMPKAGNSMEEGTIIAWRVKLGQAVAVGDALLDVETDKAAMEVEATDAGRVARIVAREGDVVEVLKPIAYLADSDADVDAYIAAGGGAPVGQADAAPAEQVPASRAATQEAGDQATAAPRTQTGRIKASPAARKIAGERGIDLSAVASGSGPGGRILSADVPQAGAKPVAQTAAGQAVRRQMSPMRKAIARNLSASKQTIPHFYIEMTFDAEPTKRFAAEQKANFPCGVNDVIVAACARAVREFPAFRSRLDGTDLLEFPSANIGIAVGMEDALVVPVVVAADELSLEQLAQRIRRIVDSARKGKIEGLGQGVFTISNLGMFGIARFSAIINPPESAILAVGAVRDEAVVANGVVRPGRVLTVTLSCDHRVIDGLAAAKFLNRLKEIIEAPQVLAEPAGR